MSHRGNKTELCVKQDLHLQLFHRAVVVDAKLTSRSKQKSVRPYSEIIC